MSEYPKKVMDIINIDEENLYNLLKELGNFNEIFKENVTYISKVTKKQGFSFYLENAFLVKPQWKGQTDYLPPPPI